MSASLKYQTTISPYEQILAYELLWARKGMTEDKLHKSFHSENQSLLPSEVLEKLQKEENHIVNNSSNDNELFSKISEIVKEKASKCSFIINGDFQYPKTLSESKKLCSSPVFYGKGNFDLLNFNSVAIVGTRNATQEGIKKAKDLAKELSKKYVIVSGLAKGIDTAVHTETIQNGGNTIAVIGTPIDECYPKENKCLQDEIAKNHLLLTKVPFYKYANEPFPSHGKHFINRNKTIARISKATIIVEASGTNGTLHQARECVAHGKKLFIASSCFNKGFRWPERFEKSGAIKFTNLNDILDNLN